MSKNPEPLSIRNIMVVAASTIVVIVGIQYLASDLITPVLLAIFLAILLLPIFRVFRRRNLSKPICIFLTIISLVVIGSSVILFITKSYSIFMSSLGQYTELFNQKLNQAIDWAAPVDGTSVLSPEFIASIVSSIVGSLGNIFFYVFIVPILSILILLQIDDSLENNIGKEQSYKFKKFKKFSESIIIYVTGRFKVNVVGGVLFAASLYFLGVDFAFMWGVLMIIMSFVPFIGGLIASVPPVFLAFAQYGIGRALAVVLASVLIGMLTENVLDPYVQGKNNKVSTAAIVIAIMFWMWLLGPVGAILATPLTVLIKIVFSEFKETAWIAGLMEGQYESVKDKKTQSQIKSIGKKIGKRLKF